jgi:PAS domain S-box-containing protein
MIDPTWMAAILDSLTIPILVADTDHVIRYVNAAGQAHYGPEEELIGRSLLECHNERSQRVILEVLEAMRAGEEERLISADDERRVYMRAVRAASGALLGYYERYEPHQEAR